MIIKYDATAMLGNILILFDLDFQCGLYYLKCLK